MGNVAGALDHVQQPVELRACRLGEMERSHPVVHAPQQRGRDVDAAELRVGNLLGAREGLRLNLIAATMSPGGTR